jgi:3-oxoacyl-[acyl-carrier-protein] synthase-3
MILSGTNRVGRDNQAGREIRSIKLFSGGPKEQLITLPAGGSRLPISDDTLSQNLHFMKMNGTRVFRLAVKKMDEAISCLLNDNSLSLQEIDLFLFHQANMRILNAVLKKKGIPSEKHHTTIRKFGNTSSSSLPIAYDDAVRYRKINPSAKICLCAFGGGFTWGAALIGG